MTTKIELPTSENPPQVTLNSLKATDLESGRTQRLSSLLSAEKTVKAATAAHLDDIASYEKQIELSRKHIEVQAAQLLDIATIATEVESAIEFSKDLDKQINDILYPKQFAAPLSEGDVLGAVQRHAGGQWKIEDIRAALANPKSIQIMKNRT